MILASEDAVKKQDDAEGVIVDSQWSALDPSIMGLGPVLALNELMKRNNVARGIDLSN